MKPNDITVVVRSCGRPLLLQRALSSIAAQTMPPDEVLVVTIGEAGANAVGGFREMRGLKLIPAIAGRSRGGALNDGIAAASGHWIAFLDDDDTWMPQFLERITPVLATGVSSADFGGVVTQTCAVYEQLNGNKIVEKRRRPFNRGLWEIDLAALAVRNRFTLNALVVRRDVFTAVGFYREDLPVLEDWEFNVRAAARFRFEIIPEPLASYHLRPTLDAAANSPLSEHRRVAAQIRNEWLRADVAAGRIGIGQLALLGEARGLGAVLDCLRCCRSRLNRWFGGGAR